MTEKNIIKGNDNILIRQQAIPGNERIFGLFNKAWISGRIESDFKFSHTESRKDFFKTRVRVKRRSGVEDFVPIMLSHRFMTTGIIGKPVEVAGQFRSRRRWGTDQKYHTDLFLYGKKFHICEGVNEFYETDNANEVYLDGNIYRINYRKMQSGIEITDILLVVQRDGSYKYEYIPCIAWGKLARAIKNLRINTRIKLYGRIQSRKYVKKSLTNNTKKIKEAYEVSIMSMKIIK